jgi:predicted Zn-dependent protease
MKVVSQYFKVIKDPVIARYVETVGQELLTHFPPQPFKYRFYVIENDVYNAFASPAGKIFINSGLLIAMDNEEELAGILSHEIAHASARHVSQRIDQSKKLNYATLAGLAAGILLGMGGSAAAANAVTMGTVAAGQSLVLSFSRANEVQADQLGLMYLTQAGYSGEGLLVMLKKMRSKQWFDSSQMPTYLSTHPGTEDRIIYIDSWLAGRPPIEPEAKVIAQRADRFKKAHTRLLALYGDEDTALRHFADAVAQEPNSYMAHYGYGLILARTERHTQALEHLKIALETNALDPVLLKEIGRIYFMDGRYQDALSTLSGAVSIAPDDPDGFFYLARTQMELGQLREAAEGLETLLMRSPGYNQAYYYLGETYGKLGEIPLAHYNLGLYYMSKGDGKNAMFHLNRASKEIRDPQKKKNIDELLNRLKKMPSPEQSKQAS